MKYQIVSFMIEKGYIPSGLLADLKTFKKPLKSWNWQKTVLAQKTLKKENKTLKSF